jgi:hypothetical protein
MITVTETDKFYLDNQRRDQRDLLRLDYQQTAQYIQLLTNKQYLPLTFLPAITGAAVAILSRFDNPDPTPGI